jgi:hypothetical protein
MTVTAVSRKLRLSWASRWYQSFYAVVVCALIVLHQLSANRQLLEPFLLVGEFFLPPASSLVRSSEAGDRKLQQHRPERRPDPSRDDELVFDGVRARAFPYWNHGTGTTDSPNKNQPRLLLPCYELETNWAYSQEEPSRTGFLFVKTVKTGSSSAAGANLRIARNVAARLGRRVGGDTGVSGRDHTSSSSRAICKARSGHVRAFRNFWDRDRSRSFMWSIVRDPNSRVLSQYFFFIVSRKGKEPSDQAFVKHLRAHRLAREHYLHFLGLSKYDKKALNATNRTAKFVNEILDSYDFIAITERMEESMVALSMLLGVPLGDVLFLKAKGKGGYDDGGIRRKCTYIRPAFLTPGFQSALNSDWWRAESRWDRALHIAANRSLDLTIDMLGRANFYKQVARYRAAQKRAHERCLSHRDVFPCTPTGEYVPPEQTQCLYDDSGCGSDCLDRVADELGLWE